jgi:hypothetical protein
MGRLMSARPPLVEYLVDAAVMKPVVTELLGRAWTDYGTTRESLVAFLDNFIALRIPPSSEPLPVASAL